MTHAIDLQAVEFSWKRQRGPLIDWDALLPDSERANFSAEAPPPQHDYLGERGAAARRRDQDGALQVLKRKLKHAQTCANDYIMTGGIS